MAKAVHKGPRIFHSLMRAKERYGLNMDVDDLKRICRMIQRNDGKLDRQNEDKTTVWFLTYRETPMRVVISPDFYKVITFLPLTDDGKWKPPNRRSRVFYRNGKEMYLGDEK